MVNWKELKAIVAIGALSAITITCLCLGIDGMLVALLLTAIGTIAGYELGIKKQLNE